MKEKIGYLCFVFTILLSFHGCDETDLEPESKLSKLNNLNIECFVDFENPRDEIFVDWNLFTKSYPTVCTGLPTVSSFGHVCDDSGCDKQKLVFDIESKGISNYRLLDVEGFISGEDSNKSKFVEVFSIYNNKLYLNLIELKKEKK